MFYDVFAELCEKRGIKPSKAAEECGININQRTNPLRGRGRLLCQIILRKE